MKESNAQTKEEYIDLCRKCGCTEEEIQELLEDREKDYQEFGFYEPWDEMAIPNLGIKKRIYYADDDGNWVDKEIGCTYEELGLTPPW